MKRFVVVAIAILLAARTFGAELKWQDDYDKALAAAKADNKILMVDVYTDWCGWCKKLDKDVYSNADVKAKLTKDFVTLKINPEKSKKNQQLARNFGTRGYPHIVFLDANGKKISEVIGYVPADKFSQKLTSLTEKSTK
ncbi:MAG TPA: thioredoxin family protein [Verrucomicrobiae bacterium]|nr:thioredoxin family protein [Verrucomicrobiae bacterium]